MKKNFRSGFVMLLGNPNAGKSTLMNALVGEKISIVTHKVQTTRHRIKGILTEENFQIVFSDTPGLLQPKYELHKSMMDEVMNALEDADAVLVLISAFDKEEDWVNNLELVHAVTKPKIFLLNKCDALKSEEEIQERISKWKLFFSCEEILPISALSGMNISDLKEKIVSLLPESPPYYSEEELTDRNERFLVSEIIREKIFLQFRQELPYSTEVFVTEFKDKEKLIHIVATIFAERETQKGILLGNKGSAIKKLGITSREEIEKFLGRKIYLELTVKVKENWRNNKNILKQLGYNQ